MNAIPDSSIELIEDFLADLTVNKGSRRQYYFNLKRFYRYLREQAIDHRTIRRRHIIRYINSLRDEQKSTLTVASYIQTIKLLMRWMVQNNYIEVNPAADIRITKEYETWRKSALTRQQVEKLLDSINTTRITGMRNKAIIFLMITTGIRLIEVKRLRYKDLDHHKEYGKVLHIQRKGKQIKDIIPLSERAFEIIQEYLVRRPYFTDDSPMFAGHSNSNLRNASLSTTQISREIKKYLQLIGLNSKLFTAHSLRHTAASLALDVNNAKADDLQNFLGHARYTTSEIYIRQQKQRKLFERRITDDIANSLASSIL